MVIIMSGNIEFTTSGQRGFDGLLRGLRLYGFVRLVSSYQVTQLG